VLLLLDLLVNRMPVIPAHSAYIALCGLAYVFANVMYTRLREPVYASVTWQDAESYWGAIVSFAIVLIAFFIAYGVTMLKQCLCIGGPQVLQADDTDALAARRARQGPPEVAAAV
jgi:hypothetical protein